MVRTRQDRSPLARRVTTSGATLAVIAAIILGAPTVEPAQAAQAPPTPRRSTTITGEIPATVLRNQLLYCSLICPHLLAGVTTVPAAAIRAPGVFADAVRTAGSPSRAAGIAAGSVSRPAHSAMAGIIVNDLTLVLPRAQNAFTVAVVEGMKTLVGQDLDLGRDRVLEALNRPITPDPPSTAIIETPAQADVVAGIGAASDLLFRAPELLLLGATETADAAATELASSGNLDAAREIGQEHADRWIAEAISPLVPAGG